MIDKKFVYNRLEDLLKEVARIEFSMEYSLNAVQAASNARKTVEVLMRTLEEEHP